MDESSEVLNRPAFKDFYFGSDDPYYEVMDDRDKFVNSFIDPNGDLSKVVSGRYTLILGPKGTGKSALAWYLQVTSAPGGGGNHIADMRTAEKLPLGDIPGLKTGQAEGRNRTTAAWTFILMANYLDIVLSDPEATVPHAMHVRRVVKNLRDAGFMAEASGPLLQRFVTEEFSIPIDQRSPLFRSTSKRAMTIFDLNPFMIEWAKKVSSKNRHMLILDGLDSIILSDAEYDESLAGLMQASSSINRSLREGGATGSVVLMLRNDIFHRVSLLLTDAHKQRAAAYDLDWRSYSVGESEGGPLLTLANAKARQGIEGQPDVNVMDYFPKRMSGSRNQKKKSTFRYLTNFTRHTPRDFLQLLEHIRKEAERRGISDGSVLSAEVIREGIGQYSNKYFVSSLRGEFTGYKGGTSAIEGALRSLKLIPKNEFSRFDYLQSVRANAPEYEDRVDEFLTLFFKAGAIANIRRNKDGSPELIFAHRRDDVDPDLKGSLSMHSALLHAWSRTGSSR